MFPFLDVLLSILYRNITYTGQAHYLKNFKIGTIVNDQSLRIIDAPLLLTILERSCCTYHFFFHFLKLLQKLDRILQKISIPPGDI